MTSLCLFYSERLNQVHLFFECVVARQLWSYMSQILDREVGTDFVSLGTMGLSNKKFLVVLLPCGGCGMAKLRNILCF